MGRTRKRYNIGGSRQGRKHHLMYGRASKKRRAWGWYSRRSSSWESSGLIWTIVDRMWEKGKTPDEIHKTLRKHGLRSYEIRSFFGDWNLQNHFIVKVVGITALSQDGDLWHHIPIGSYDVTPAFKMEFGYGYHSLSQRIVLSDGKLYKELTQYELKTYQTPNLRLIKYFERAEMAPLKPFPNPLLTSIMRDIIENYILSDFEGDMYYVSGWIKGTLRIREL